MFALPPSPPKKRKNQTKIKSEKKRKKKKKCCIALIAFELYFNPFYITILCSLFDANIYRQFNNCYLLLVMPYLRVIVGMSRHIDFLKNVSKYSPKQ
jgi:hypothetical protein